jgi:hypothetical protein
MLVLLLLVLLLLLLLPPPPLQLSSHAVNVACVRCVIKPHNY